MTNFKRLVRFAQGEAKYFGELLNADGSVYTIKKLLGNPFNKLEATEEIIKTEQVRQPRQDICQNL